MTDPVQRSAGAAPRTNSPERAERTSARQKAGAGRRKGGSTWQKGGSTWQKASPSRRLRRVARTRTVVRGVAIGVAVFSVLTAVLILVACFVDDQRIDQNMGSSTATVTEVTDRRAAVEFDAGEGMHVRPVTGVFYPVGLVEGQRVQVEFRRTNPDLVRVSGRSWTDAVVPALSVPAFAVPLAALAYAAASPGIHLALSRVRRRVSR